MLTVSIVADVANALYVTFLKTRDDNVGIYCLLTVSANVQDTQSMCRVFHLA